MMMMMMMKMVMILMILQAELVDLPGSGGSPLDESLAARPLPLAGFSVFQIL